MSVNRSVLKSCAGLFSIFVLFWGSASAWAVPPEAQPQSQELLEKSRPFTIDCDRGDSLSNKIARKKFRTSFRFSGTCVEEAPIIIDRRLSLEGVDDAVLEGGGLLIRSTSGVELSSFTIRDVAGGAIAVTQGAEASIRDMTIEDSGVGILVEDAVASIGDSMIRNQQVAGILNRAATVSLHGAITADNTGQAGIAVTDGGIIRVADPAAVLEATGNFRGFVIQLDSSMHLRAGKMVASGNSSDGIRIFGSSTFTQVGEVVSEQNGGMGASLAQNCDWVIPLEGQNTTRLSDNANNGIQVAGGGTASLIRMTITGNGVAGVITDANVVVPFFETVVRDNVVADVFLAFGSVVSFLMGTEVGSPIICQDEVLVRGIFSCEIIQPVGSPSIGQELEGLGSAVDFSLAAASE